MGLIVDLEGLVYRDDESKQLVQSQLLIQSQNTCYRCYQLKSTDVLAVNYSHYQAKLKMKSETYNHF